MHFLDKINFSKLLLAIYLIIFTTIIISAFIQGATTSPWEGDSVNLHIPIAKSILSGGIFKQGLSLVEQNPASSELILAIFIILNIPLNLYNVFSVIILFITGILLGSTFKLNRLNSIFFSLSICTLYDVLRYLNTQKIDIWLLIFYIFSVYLLTNPKNKLSYFFKLGLSLGMVFGSKYSGPFFVIILLLLYFKDLIKYKKITNVIVFSIPFILFGFIWYIRNFIYWGDPFYPQSFLFFKGDSASVYYNWPYWKILLTSPTGFINALISEYMVWILAVVVLPFSYISSKFFKMLDKIKSLNKIILLAVINILYFFFIPAPPTHDYNAIVFGIRYSLPAITLVILSTFLIFDKYNKSLMLNIVALANTSFIILPFGYHPKLLFVYVPLLSVSIFVVYKSYKYIHKLTFTH